MNLGTHPTAYIRIPKGHKYYEVFYDEIDLSVHGGLTYSEDYLNISENQKVDGYFIGWDYGHCGDYAGYEMAMPEEYRTDGKKWTTEEILKEVREACYQLTTKSAEYLFKKLGYKKRFNKSAGYFEYVKGDEAEKGTLLCISFDTRQKSLMCALYRSGAMVSRALAIFPEEFKAIQEQMKELGWLDE